MAITKIKMRSIYAGCCSGIARELAPGPASALCAGGSLCLRGVLRSHSLRPLRQRHLCRYRSSASPRPNRGSGRVGGPDRRRHLACWRSAALATGDWRRTASSTSCCVMASASCCRLGWWLMELPCSVLFWHLFWIQGGSQSSQTVPRILGVLFTIHCAFTSSPSTVRLPLPHPSHCASASSPWHAGCLLRRGRDRPPVSALASGLRAALRGMPCS